MLGVSTIIGHSLRLVPLTKTCILCIGMFDQKSRVYAQTQKNEEGKEQCLFTISSHFLQQCLK